MLAIPRRIKGISHPFIKDIYMKKEIAAENNIKNILVITARKNNASNPYNMSDLLSDLKGLQEKVERRLGRFDRVDIKAA